MEFLVGICSSVVGEIAKVTVYPIGRQLGYLFYYKSNIDHLTKQLDSMKDQKTSIHNQVEQADIMGEEAEEYVKKWQKEVEKICQEAEDFLNDEGHHRAKCSCSGSLLSRYQLSRKSKKMAETIASEIQKVGGFQNMFYRRLFKASFENRDFDEFDTRTPTFKEIMEALEDSNCSRIGVYGTGGVGKTTLVTEVADKAQKKGLFSKAVMVTVSQSYDIMKIQKEIAEKLSLKLQEESMSVIATRLRERLVVSEKILLILDDIWETLNLNDIGICSKEDQRGCKILFVSRNQRVLADVNVDKAIEVEVLSEEEASKLFKKYVGHKSEEHNFNELVTKIVKRCGGLPIAVVTIARALKSRDIHAWRDTLWRLKSSPREGFGEAYLCIKTSYDFLQSIQERKILLLCSLHEEDANVDVDCLTSIYAAWSNMFQERDTLAEARDSVYTSVDNLKERCLLLKGDRGGSVKVHDVIRQIMLSIALKDEGMYYFENSKCLKNDSTAISLSGRNFDQLPDNLACPKLKLLLVHQQFWFRDKLVPKGFLQETKELRALCLQSVIVKPLSLSPRSLQNLQTLSLQDCVLEDLAFIGELENLMILDLSHSKFQQLPEQIGKLTRLRQLNLRGCTDLEVIPPNVMRSLKKLEELYLNGVETIKWGLKEDDGDGQNASLAELMDLPLTALHLYIPDPSALPKNMFVHGNLERYNIQVGKTLYRAESCSRVLMLELKEQSHLNEYGFERLIKEAEELHLRNIPGVKNIVNQLDADGFPQLKELNIKANDEVRYIVESTGEMQPCSVFKNLERLELRSLPNLERMCFGRFTADSFGQLKSIRVSSCHKMKNVLSYTVVRKLEEVSVSDCHTMNEILIYRESEDHATNYDEIEFSCLRSLTLEGLKNLIQFFSSEMETTDFLASSSVTPGMPLFNEKVSFPSLEFLRLDGMDLSKLWPHGLPSTSSMQNLTTLEVGNCNKIKHLFPFAIVGSLKQLEHLVVSGCPVMEEIIKEGSTQSGRKIMFPKLRSVKLRCLENLKKFCGGDYHIECESLLEICISKCLQLETFTFTSMKIEQILFNEKAISFPRLEKLKVISSCESLKHLISYEMTSQLKSLKVVSCLSMEEVVVVKETEERRSLNKVSFPKLTSLKLSSLQMLKGFSSPHCIPCFPSLLKLNVDESFFSEKVPTGNVFSDMNFRNLQELEISIILPFATAEGLKQLKNLIVGKCEVMKHVISKAIGEDGRLKKISFPKLEFIFLNGLSKLESFCEEADCIECPSLLSLTIYSCGKLRTFIPNSASTHTLIDDEQEVEVRESETKHSLFNEKVVFSNLKRLYLTDSAEDVKEIWPRQSATLLFPKLKYLRFRPCQPGSDVSFFNLYRHENLETIKLSGLAVEKIWQRGELGDAEDHRNTTLAGLWGLTLRKVSKSMYLFENLENTDLTPQTFQTLKTLLVESCPDLKTIAMPSYFSFNNLTDVVIRKCHGMISIFDSSTARSLEQLTRMSISECYRMTQVIHMNSEDEAESDEIVFRQLKMLALHDLPSLQGFHCGKNMLKFPYLERLIVSECPQMRSFSHGTMNSPNLDRIITKLEYLFVDSNVEESLKNLERDTTLEELILESDLNRSISKLWEDNYDPLLALRGLFSETEEDENYEEDTDEEEDKNYEEDTDLTCVYSSS